MKKPKYKQECSRCRFLGTDSPRLEEEKDVVDMYVHDNGDYYILYRRYGDEEEDFNYINFSPYNLADVVHVAWLPLIKKISN